MSIDLSSEMRGPIGIRHDVATYLRGALPKHVLALARALDLDDPELPVDRPDDARADAYVAREPAALDRWPLVAVTSGGRTTQRQVDTDDDGSPVFRSTYPVRVWSWVKAEGRDETQDLRDVYATAVRIAVLARPSLGAGGRLAVVPSTLTVDYSRLEAVKGDRFVAGSYVGFDVAATETLTDRLAYPVEQPRDTVGSVTATGHVLDLRVSTSEDGS